MNFPETETVTFKGILPDAARIIRDMRLEGNFDAYREVVVIIPSGAYLDPKELGRYESSLVAYKIMEAFPEVEFKMFYLDDGSEVKKH